MPTKIDVADWVSGVPNGAGVSYLYRADGLKVRKMVTDLSSNKRFYTDYLTGFQYGYDEWLFGGTSLPVLSFFPHSEGYVNNRAVYTNPWDSTPSSYVYEYVYNHTDHLGNVRLSYSDKNKDGFVADYWLKDPYCSQVSTYPGQNGCRWDYISETIEENNYYPFGLKHKGYNDNFYPQSYKYKYNGKELQDELNLNVYDFSARVFDPASIVAWQHNPLSEQTLTPYSLFYGNPVFYNDPTGMGPNDIHIQDKEGNHLFTLDDGKKEVTTMTVSEVYNKGIQWSEPQANNYMPLKSVEPILSSPDYKGALHTSFRSIVEWTIEENKGPLTYSGVFGTDWKASSTGGRGYLLSEIDGKPFWTDALGQISYSIDTYEYFLKNNLNIMKVIYLILLTFFMLTSCEKNKNNSCIDSYLLYIKYYKGLSKMKSNSKLFRIKYDSTNYYLDKYMECNPNSVELIRYKLGLLSYNKDYKKMIPFYNKLLLSDSLDIKDREKVKFAKFYYMLILDSVKYKKEIKSYYKEVKEKEPNISDLLKNLKDNHMDIYKRLKLSYYFEGREKTLEDFKYLKDTMPYKLDYLTVQEQSITPFEFLKIGME